MPRPRLGPLRPALLLAVGVFAARGVAEEPSPLTLCLAPAADDSPVYPLREVPANHREFVVACRLRAGESFQKLTGAWTAVDVGEAAPPNSEIGRTDLPLRGSSHGHFRYSLPRDFPIGKYRFDVAADGVPWASLEFSVVPAAEPVPAAKPEELIPLSPGTTWTYAWLLEPGPAVKNLTVTGAERGEDGKFRATTSISVAERDGAVARMEWRRGGAVVGEEWWSLGAEGLAVVKAKAGETTVTHDPPLPILALPLRSAHAWTHQPKGDPARMEYRMWGPLPLPTPTGEAPGWVVWMRNAAGPRVSTIERQIVPGVGVVRESHVDVVGTALLTRIETALLPGK